MYESSLLVPLFWKDGFIEYEIWFTAILPILKISFLGVIKKEKFYVFMELTSQWGEIDNK